VTLGSGSVGPDCSYTLEEHRRLSIRDPPRPAEPRAARQPPQTPL